MTQRLLWPCYKTSTSAGCTGSWKLVENTPQNVLETRANNTAKGPEISCKTHHKRSRKIVQITPQKVLEFHGKHATKGPGNLWINTRKGPGMSWKTHHNRSWKLVDKHKRSWKLSIALQCLYVCMFRRVSPVFIVLMLLVFTAETVRELIPLYCLAAMRMIRYLSFSVSLHVSVSVSVTVSLSLYLSQILCLCQSMNHNVTHRQLLSIDQVWRRSTTLTWSRWDCRRLAELNWTERLLTCLQQK